MDNQPNINKSVHCLVSWMTNQHMKSNEWMNMKDKTKEIAIIGGGLAGLTAAVYLSRGGKNVTIIEKSSEFGGRARTTLKGWILF